MRTTADLFAALSPWDVYDADGESFTGSDVNTVPPDTTVHNATFFGQSQLYTPNRVTFQDCHFHAGTSTTDHGLLRMLSGNGWRVLDCDFTGGTVDAQLGVGLDLRNKGSVPKNWLVSACEFMTLDGQWGNYPQGHQLYVLADPGTNLNGLVEFCDFHGSPYGAPVKLGGTGNQPHTEGTVGVTVADCDIQAHVDVAGRCLAVLTQGDRTDVTLRACNIYTSPLDVTPIGVTPYPWVQAMDGARLRMEAITLPDGVTQHSTWFYGYFWKKESKVSSLPDRRPPTCGGITWT